MKKLLFIISFFIALASQAQYQLSDFRDTIKTWLPNDTLNGDVYQRDARYVCLIDNRRPYAQTVAISAVVTYYKDSVAFPWIPSYEVTLIADRDHYVLPTGDFIGTMYDVQNAYGIYDSTTATWSYTVAGIMPEAAFYEYVGTLQISMRNMILGALMKSSILKKSRTVAAGKLIYYNDVSWLDDGFKALWEKVGITQMSRWKEGPAQ